MSVPAGGKNSFMVRLLQRDGEPFAVTSERSMRRSFRSPEKQAEKSVSRVLALGQPRHGNQDDGKIHSVGTARAYQQALTGVAQWLKGEGNQMGLNHITTAQAQAYLEYRVHQVGQKSLDLDRQALRILPSLDRDALVRLFTQADRPRRPCRTIQGVYAGTT